MAKINETSQMGIMVCFFRPKPNGFKLPSALYKKAGSNFCIIINKKTKIMIVIEVIFFRINNRFII